MTLIHGTPTRLPASGGSLTMRTGRVLCRSKMTPEVAGPGRIKMLGDNDGNGERRRQRGHQARKRLDSARGRADDHQILVGG